MAKKSWHLPRRAFLRGTGITLALPFMNAMAFGKEQQALNALPKRSAFIFFPNGSAFPRKLTRNLKTGTGSHVDQGETTNSEPVNNR